MLCMLFCPTALHAAAFQVPRDDHMDADSKISISQINQKKGSKKSKVSLLTHIEGKL